MVGEERSSEPGDNAEDVAAEEPAPHDAGSSPAVVPKKGPPPTVPDDADQDVPPEGEVETQKVDDPDSEHRRTMDRTKLHFGMWLIGSCLSLVVVLSGVQFLLQEKLDDASALTNALDVLKLVATTALGFVFGRTVDAAEKKE